MRILSALLVVAALILQTEAIVSAETAGRSDQGIQWVANFDEALALGRAENKPVFIDFFNPK